MAITGTDRGTGNNNTAGTSFTLSPSGNFAANSVAVLTLANDNSGGGGATQTITVTDSIGNTWTRRQSPTYDPGAANAGVEGGFFECRQNVGPLTTGTTITVTFANSTTAKAWTLQELIPSTGFGIAYVTGGVGTGSATATPTVLTGTITNGNVVIGGLFNEQGTGQTVTQDGDTTNGNWSTQQTNEVGTTAAGITVSSQRKIVTASATQTFNPTLGTSSDVILGWVEYTELVLPLLNTAVAHAQPPPTGAREFAGYGVALVSLAALLAPPPPGTDTVAAAEYQVGTHQEAVARSQPAPRVWGTSPTLAPLEVATPVGKFWISLPEQVASGSAEIWGPTPRTADPVQRGSIGAAPEQVNSGSAWLGHYPPESAAPPVGDTSGVNYTVGTHQHAIAAMQPKPWVLTRHVVPAVIGTDVRVGKWFGSAPEQVASGHVHISGQTPPDPIAIVRYYEADQQSTEQWGGRVWGRVVTAVVGTDTPIGKTRAAAPEQVNSGAAEVWGTPRPAVVGFDVAIGITRFAAPEQIKSGDAWLTGPQPPNASVVIVSTQIAIPELTGSQGTAYGWGRVVVETAQFRPPPKTLWAAPAQVSSGSVWIEGPQPPNASTVIVRTKIAIPEITGSQGTAWSWTAYPTADAPVTGPDPKPSRTTKVKTKRTTVTKSPSRTERAKALKRTEKP